MCSFVPRSYIKTNQIKPKKKTNTLKIIRESPLVMYIFTMEPEVQNLFVHGTQSGGILLNDTIMHYAGKKKYMM